ncbi:MAG TPA: DsbA family protein [Bryobacteraceae bacterium]|jgi:protein-disulfide isomerase
MFASVTAASAVLSAAVVSSGAPKLDKQKLQEYLRYAEGFTSNVQIALDDPAPSSVEGYYRILAHLTMGTQKADRVYYLTPDGKHLISGSVWDLNKSPFTETQAHLPTDGPSFGPANAKVTIVIFSDFECPYCREFAKTIRDNVPKKYPSDVRVIFEDFPLETIHKWALAAAEAAHCLEDQKPTAFWAFHDWVFEHQQEVNEANVRQKALDLAKTQDVDLAKAGSCMDTHATGEQVKRSIAAGRILQIQQTPTVFVNGRTIPGAVPWSSLDTVIQMELNRPRDIPGVSAEKCCSVAVPTVAEK